jgi:hypothetical protein
MRRDVCPKGPSLWDAAENRFRLSRRRSLCWRIARAERYVTHISGLPEEPPWYYRTRTRDTVAATWEALGRRCRYTRARPGYLLLLLTLGLLLVLLAGLFGLTARNRYFRRLLQFIAILRLEVSRHDQFRLHVT